MLSFSVFNSTVCIIHTYVVAFDTCTIIVVCVCIVYYAVVNAWVRIVRRSVEENIFEV